MEISVAGKQALIGGASRGIGRATALELATNGAHCCLISRSRSALEQVIAELDTSEGQNHSFIAADSGNPEELAKLVSDHFAGKSVNILVNNTGGPPEGQASSARPEEYTLAFAQHVLCNQAVLQAVLPGMRSSGYGRIINIISTSVKQPIPNLGVSNTIRGAVASWAKTLAGELGPYGITVNNVLPGFTETDRLDEILDTRAGKTGKSADEIGEALKNTVPLRRFARASETAAAVAFLASPAAAYINGINLPVDGGRTSSL